MNSGEILKRYGLKTDISSIKERIETNDYWKVYWSEATQQQQPPDGLMDIYSQLYHADLDLLCEMAVKTEKIMDIYNQITPGPNDIPIVKIIRKILNGEDT